MDPKANIQEQVEIARRILRELDQDRRPSDADVGRLAELALALDDWRKQEQVEIARRILRELDQDQRARRARMSRNLR